MPEPTQTRLHRLIDLLRYVQTGPRFNAGQLAHRYGVARRTIFRDIRLLRACGIPLHYDEANEAYYLGHDGGLNVDQLSGAEHLALLVAAVLSSPLMRNMATEAKLNEALQHIMSSFSPEARAQACHVANAIVAQHQEPQRSEAQAGGDIWSLLVEAIGHRKQIRIEVNTPEGPLQTMVAPYQVVAGQSGSKLVGRSSLHREIREFALSSIRTAEITAETFETPKGTLSRLRRRQNPSGPR